MPVTTAQLKRVLNVNGHAYVDPVDVPNTAKRFAESYIRRRLFALEDQAVIDQYALYKAAFEDIRGFSVQTADALGIQTLANDGVSIQWRREVLFYTEQRLDQLGRDAALIAYHTSVLTYLTSYYGRAWGMDVSTIGAFKPNVPLIDAQIASQAVLDKQLLEVARPDVGNEILYDMLGIEWREVYRNELGDVVTRIRRALTTGLGDGDDIRQSMRRVSDVLGVEIDRRKAGRRIVTGPRGGQKVVYNRPDVRANFNRVQTLTRSFVINSSNQAALNLYEANADVLMAVEFLPSNDGRVCPICEGYRGETWPLGSPDIIRPVADTHPNCRCSLIPVLRTDLDDFDVSDLLVDNNAAPGISFSEWMIDIGAAMILDKFFSSRDLDSSRV